MTKVADFSLSLKLRLRETTDTKWNDEILIEVINNALAKISRDLLLFKDIAVYQASIDKVFYLLPNHKIRTISITLDDNIIQYKSFEWVMTNPHKIPSSEIYAYETQDGLTFTQSPTTGTIRLAYNSTRRVDSQDEPLPISDFAEESLMLYCLYLANQRGSSELSFKESQNYLGLYMQEVERLQAALNKNYRSKNITTQYQRV